MTDKAALSDEFPGLDRHADHRARTATSLFRLFALCAGEIRPGPTPTASVDADAKSGRQERTLRLWSNQPGQNRWETWTLALLSFWLIAGSLTGMFAEAMGAHWWTWLAAPAAAVAATFFLLHLFALTIGLASTVVRLVADRPPTGTRSLSVFLSLAALTVFAATQALDGDKVSVISLLAAGPWLLWAIFNLVAWLILLLIDLAGALSRL